MTPEKVEFSRDGSSIVFHVDKGGFSPFVLTWEAPDEPDTPVTPPSTRYYEITATAGEGGSISPSGTHSYAAGSDVTFTITPDEGWTVGDVTVDGVSYRQLGSYTFEDLDDDHTISVTFMRGSDPTSPDETGVSDWLNASDHVAYLHGYGDGSFTFGPENPMTRAEVAQMFYNLLLDKGMGDRDVAFEDVPEGAYYAEPVRVLASRGILNGTGPETFEPNRAITRAEFVAIAMRFSNGAPDGENTFVDVPEDAWYRDYVVGATSFGWIYGYQDGSHRFGPDDTITRGQATMVTNRMLWRSCDTAWALEHLDQVKTFVDLPQGHYAFFDVVEATNAHDYERVGGTRYEDWTGLRE
ncbi:S-layer homology domain-containing protein [Thermophilibacter mediterraneus]|uniref:S-layer homology domain-containing protein n=1 Tax=Thermophilibacter mediterraneus TaxID=1871031 RepID=UPI002353D394|nr:S-layer homology domain-containing protein [Thermophilibacter mediterraneus]